MNLWNQKFSPMLLSEIDKPFDSKDYIYEIKYDGIRALIYVDGKNLRIINRNLIDMTNTFPELDYLKNKVNKKVIFDGEIIAEVDGKPSFSKLQNRIHLKNNSLIKKLSISDPVTFIAFDCIYEDKNLTNLPLYKRKEYLNKYEDDNSFIKSIWIKEKGVNLFNKIKDLDLEGIIAKRYDGKYYINKRTDEWIKIKNYKTEEFFIGGYIIKKSKFVISVLLGEFIDNKLYYVGNMALSKKNKIYNELIKQNTSKNYFVNYKKDANFIKPLLKIKVSYIERTKNNSLRQPFVSHDE